MSECKHEFVKNGYCEWESIVHTGQKVQQDILECSKCKHREESEIRVKEKNK